jgi:hypothetical protein
VPLVPGEYWVHTPALARPVHVRIASPVRAFVDGAIFDIERNVTAQDGSAGSGGGPGLRGDVVLRAPSPALGVDSIAVDAGPNGTLGEVASLRLATSSSTGCLQIPNMTWVMADGSVEPDVVETEVFGPPPDVILLPWDSFRLTASKPAQDLLSQDSYARGGPQQQPLEIEWLQQQVSSSQASGRFADWLPLVGREVELGGRLVNTNGAGADGATDWTVTLSFLDFGPSRSGLLDFSQGLPDDVVVAGATQALVDSPACATEATPAARDCLQLSPGSRLALRFAGPLTGLRVDSRSESASGVPAIPTPSIMLVATDGTPVQSGDPANAFATPVEDVLVLMEVPTTFNTQLDPNCAQPLTGSVLVVGIEPLP